MTNENRANDPNLWNAAKAVLKEKITAKQSCLRKQEKSQNNLTVYLIKLKAEEKKS